MRSEPAWGAHGWESAPVWGPTVVRIPGQGALGGERPAAACTSIEFSKTQNASLYQTAQTDGGCGCNPPGGEKAESPVSDGTSPPPTPVPYSSWRPLGPAVPGLLVAAGHEAAGGLSGARLNGPGSSAAGKGPLQPPGTPAPSARVLLQRPLPIGLEEKVPLPAPRRERASSGGGAGERRPRARGGARVRSAEPREEPGHGAGAEPRAGRRPQCSRLQSERTCSRRPLWAESGMGL